MILPLLPLAAVAAIAAAGQDSGALYDGRARAIAVRIPRFDGTIKMDGALDEAVWARAARLVGFSQYQPVDSRPAEEPTEVSVWYGPTAIYFGIRAREVHGDVVRATRADRDNIASDDHVQILLDTYNDRRRAFLFGVNPYGVQQDGVRSDQFAAPGGFFAGGGGFGGNFNPLEGNVDLNPDFVFESRGRLVPGGYEVEVRIPFKSLRYASGDVQTWGVNVLRRVRHSGYQDSWAPVVRASASFLAQSGSLQGLENLRRGLVLEATPFATTRVDGLPAQAGYRYADTSELGLNVRYGVTPNLSLDATWNPDFSQVEADVGQVTLNERFALFYPEKRPFFLDGLELFEAPNRLIYTRQIVSPDGGVKLAGKIGATNVGVLLAAEDPTQSVTGRQPLFGIVRLRRDLGRSSTFGVVGTAREDGDDYSRLVGADVRVVHSRLYFVELQAVESWTRGATGPRSGPLFQATWDRTGRSWGFNYGVTAISPDFRAAAGFVNRVGVVDGHLSNRLTIYGRRGALLETLSSFFSVRRLWRYDDFGREGALEGSEGVAPSATLRGGWSVGGGLSRQFYRFEAAPYEGYQVEVPGPGGTLRVPFGVPRPLTDLFALAARVTTPTFRTFT
ncbi:MAG: carbohydrate binding family 9 domain-containing protein, partial [Gemmatimonadetes bacterium]|nr:carbohydrate binding family 9 domain-containing protein [Gemmatimonadota bacterium]